MDDDSQLPSVSLLLPIRNEAKFIGTLLEQLLQQDYPAEKLEILVADGMSNDGTREIVANVARHTSRVRWLDNPGCIVATGLNLIIPPARGDVLMRLDGHTEISCDYVRTSVLLLRSNPEAWGVGGPIVHIGKTLFGKAIAAAMSHPIGMGNATHRLPNFEGYAEGAAFWTFHRWVFDRVGLFDENLVRTEDDEFNFRVAQAGGKIFLSPQIRSSYFVRDTVRHVASQFFQYSFWRIPVMKKHRRPTTFRQIVPPLFFLMMLAALVVGCVLRQPIIALGLPVLYLAMLLCVGLSLIPRLGVLVGLLVPVALIVMHTSYAAGMLYGLVATIAFPNAWNQQGRMSQLSR